MMGNHALVFGSTGILGWAITNELLHGYPSPDAFERVTALSNRPLTDNTLWPESKKLKHISGIDLLTEHGQEGLERQMQESISGIESVSHVFFCAYIFKLDPDEECSINVKLLERAIRAVQSLSKELTFVLLPTGTKAYGVHMFDKFPFSSNIPLSEDLPRIPEPWASQNFYYHLCDCLTMEARGKEWTWCEIRPDIVVGFIPNNNYYGLTQALATYLALYREIKGEGKDCPFPGTKSTYYKQINNDASQDIIARFAIHCSLHPETCGGGQAFNIADNSKAATWETKWPIICEYFGLNGVGPAAEGRSQGLPDFLRDNLSHYKTMESKYDLVSERVGNDRTVIDVLQALVSYLDFDRSLDLTKCHKAWNTDGRAEQIDSYTAWWTAFQRFRQARIIP